MRLVTILLPTQTPADHAPLPWSDFRLAPTHVETFAQGLIPNMQFAVLWHDDWHALLLLGLAWGTNSSKTTSKANT